MSIFEKRNKFILQVCMYIPLDHHAKKKFFLRSRVIKCDKVTCQFDDVSHYYTRIVCICTYCRAPSAIKVFNLRLTRWEKKKKHNACVLGLRSLTIIYKELYASMTCSAIFFFIYLFFLWLRNRQNKFITLNTIENTLGIQLQCDCYERTFENLKKLFYKNIS